MININIIGSCVSRDIFTFDEGNFENNVYIARTSILSNLQHKNWSIDEKDLKIDSKFQKEAVIRDLNKTVYKDIAKDNTTKSYLIVDFIDERFKIAKIDDKYATYSVELMNSKWLEGKDFELLDKVPKKIGYGFSFEGVDIEHYIREFAYNIKKIYEPDKIIIHEAYMCEQYVDEAGYIQIFKPHILDDVIKKNKMLKYMYKALEKYIPEAYIINLFDGNQILANSKHVWKLAPMHYEDKYYKLALEKIFLITKGNQINATKTTERKNLADFNSEDVEVEVKGNAIKAINHFESSNKITQYSWYINEIKNNHSKNIYKSSAWSTNNSFEFEFENDSDAEFLLIGYVKFTDDNKRVCKTIANFKNSAKKGIELIAVGSIERFDKKNIIIRNDFQEISLNVEFDACGSLKYSYYVFQDDFNNLVYKSKEFTDSGFFTYIPSDLDSEYFFQVYIKDTLGHTNSAKTEGVKCKLKRKGIFGIIFSEFNCDMVLPQDEIIGLWADEILNGKLYVHRDFKDPLYVGNSINWDIVYKDSPGSYQLYLQSLGTITILTKAYLLKKETKYLEKANEILLSWIEYEKSDQSKDNALVWHDHGSALRANSIMYFALVAEQAGIIDEITAIFIKGLVKEHAEFLSTDSNYTMNHNHGIFQDQSLFYCAYFLNDDKSDEYLQIARKRLIKQITFAFNDEKVHVENSSAYHIELLYMLDVIAKFLENMEDYFSYFVKDNIKESADFCAYLNRPTGNLINTGDSSVDNSNIKIDVNTENLGSDLYTYSATQGKKGKKPEYNSIIYPKSGYYFFKQDADSCDSFIDVTWKMFKSGYSSKTHKHADDLSFALYSKGYDIFIDTGYYNYNPGNVFCDYFKSSAAHNTVIVDGLSYSVENENSYKVGIYDYEMTNDYDHITGYNEMYNGVSIDRHFYSVGDITVIYDNIKSRTEHVYSQIFHLAENIEILNYCDDEVLLGIGDSGYRTRIIQCVKGCELSIIEGREKCEFDNEIISVEGGYASYGQNQITAIKSLHFSAKDVSRDFVTIITIEDKNGRTIFDSHKNKAINFNSFFFDKDEKILLLGSKKIEFKERIRRNMNSVVLQITDNKLRINDSLPNNDSFEYEYELIDKNTYLIFKKKLYSNDDVFEEVLPPKDILIKGKLRRKGKELNKKVIAYIKYNIETETHYIANDDYPFLNLYYRGHCYNKKDDNEYQFKVLIDYSFDYKVKWYVYRNGAYHTVQMTENENIFCYKFESPGSYTVTYYVMTNLGEKYMYNFESIII